jgi:hypothetical protein
MTQEHRIETPLTDEQNINLRRASLSKDLPRAARAAGGRLTDVAGRLAILNPEIFGLDRPPATSEQPSLDLPYIRGEDGVWIPLENRMASPLEITGHRRKTPAKELKYLAEATPEPTRKKFTVAQAGPNFRNSAIATSPSEAVAQEEVLAQAGVVPGEPFRMLEVIAVDKATVAQVLEERGNELPWATDLTLRPDGTLPALWHNCKPSGFERERVLRQHDEDRRAKRERRDRVIRDMLREPI